VYGGIFCVGAALLVATGAVIHCRRRSKQRTKDRVGLIDTEQGDTEDTNKTIDGKMGHELNGNMYSPLTKSATHYEIARGMDANRLFQVNNPSTECVAVQATFNSSTL
jgi:hypothetical protein